MLKDIINLIVNNGMAVVVIGYFIYKDNTTQKTMIETINEIKGVLIVVKEYFNKNGGSKNG